MVMSIWTREELLAQIDICKAAIKKATLSHAYNTEGRSLTNQSLEQLRKQLVFLRGELAALEGKGSGPHFVTARPRR